MAPFRGGRYNTLDSARLVEGEAINRIYRAASEGVNGLVTNPAGFNYAGYALRDCVKGAALPYVEAHMTNVEMTSMWRILLVGVEQFQLIPS
jgi:3-dehydroquinate dehydratase